MEKPGTFARMHAQLLAKNNWDCIAQEILISTPRRFGKTISVSMFCTALLLSCPAVEISIYSTCKRISQKILRNVMKFAMMIADQDLGEPRRARSRAPRARCRLSFLTLAIRTATINCRIKRENMEEIYLEGPLGNTDIRIINSYPSKVEHACPELQKSAKVRKSLCKSPRRTERSKAGTARCVTGAALGRLLPGSRRHRKARRSSWNRFLYRRVSD
jgi:hypothetical protein